MSMDKEVKKELLEHLISAMDSRTKGRIKKPAAAPAKEEPSKEEPKAAKCADCGKMTCACDDMDGGETASEEVAAPAAKTMKDRLKAMIAAKADKE